MSFFQVAVDKPALQPSTLFEVAGFPVTSTFLMISLVFLLLVVFVVVLNKKLSMRPGKLQLLFEMLYEGMVGLVDQITKNRKITEQIFPLIGALFIFVGLGNLIGLIPGLTSITFEGKEFFRSPTSDFNTTFALALAMILLVQIESMKDWGVFGYLGKFFQFKEVVQGFRKGIGEGMVAIINFLIGLLDIISELAKVVSLSMRLFGNIYAGEILMTILLGAFAYALPSIWLGMNVFVGVIQALVFGALVAAYYVIAKKPESE